MSLIVHKHRTTATTLTALIPPFVSLPSLSLSFFVFDWRQRDGKQPSFKEMQGLREPWPVAVMAGKACVYILAVCISDQHSGLLLILSLPPAPLRFVLKHTYKQMQKSRFISPRPVALLYWLKILGKHSVWHAEIKIVEVQLIRCVYGPDMQYIVCVYRPYLVYTVVVHQ